MSVASAPELERASAEDVLRYAAEQYHPRLVVASSFQKESSVILDMLLRIEPEARFFTIDNGALFEETYATKRALEERYGLEIEVFDSNPERRPLTSEDCCGDNKVAAFKRAISTADAWITGLRREHSPERAGTPKYHWDERNGLWKFAPLADWTERDVWRYLAEHEVPYNALHDRGYESIGCSLCTQPGSGRQGRWAGTDRTECGLHG